MTQVAYKTDPGMVAAHNEDYVWVDDSRHVFVVADGMGGHESGDIASRLTATTAGEFVVQGLAETAPPLAGLLVDAIEKANNVVWQASEVAGQLRRMGATLVMAVLQQSTAYIAHAGDARVYLANEQAFKRLTQDDSWVAHLVASGVMSEEESRNSRIGHVITKAIGQEEAVSPTIQQISVQPGDWLLLCSDGLWNMVDDDDIHQTLLTDSDPAQVVEKLVQQANDAGGRDNISIIAVKIT